MELLSSDETQRAFRLASEPARLRERYGVEDEKMRRFRYGVQVNSLGLTEAQPENNVQRIVLEMLGVTLSNRPTPIPGVDRLWALNIDPERAADAYRERVIAPREEVDGDAHGEDHGHPAMKGSDTAAHVTSPCAPGSSSSHSPTDRGNPRPHCHNGRRVPA